MGRHRLIAPTAAAFALVVASGCSEEVVTSPTTPSAPVGERALVEHVNDGDTITLAGGRQIRLVQIDAPELTSDCYGTGARNVLDQMIPSGTRVTLMGDSGLDDQDTYRRLLRYVFVDGRNVNLELVRRGAAVPYFFRKARGRFARQLLAAVTEARGRGRGLWGACPQAELDPYRGALSGRR